MKIETERKKWIEGAEKQEKNILKVVNNLKKDIEEIDQKISTGVMPAENCFFEYIEQSSVFKVAKCMYLLSQGTCMRTLRESYLPITLEIAEEVLEKNKDVFAKGSYKRDVNFFYRRAKALVNDLIMQKGMEKYKIQFAFEMYKELKFKILNFEEIVKNNDKGEHLYKLIEESININYLVNRIYDEVPYICKEMKKHLKELNYSQLNMLGVQYQELQ